MQSVLIILLVMVSLVQGVRKICGDNDCSILSPEVMPISRTQNCKCCQKYMKWLKAHKPQRRFYDKDDDAIYYEPAENVIRQNQQLAYPLQYTRNPAIYPYYINKLPTNIIPDFVYRSKQFPRSNYAPNLFTKPDQKKSNHGVHIGTNYAPLYLNININESNDDEVSQPDGVYQNKMTDLIIIKIENCLDLHVIIHSRNQGNGSTVSEKISERNKIYNELSDADLINEINKKCNELASTVNESIDEIKSKLPNIKNSNGISRDGKYNDEIETTRNSSQSNNTSQNQNHHLNEVNVPDIHLNLETSTVETMKPPIQSIPPTTLKNGLDIEVTSDLLKGTTKESVYDESVTDAPLTSLFTEITMRPYLNLSITPQYNQETTSSIIENATVHSLMTPNDILITTKSNIILTNNSHDVNQTFVSEDTTMVDDTVYYIINYTTEKISDVSDQIKDDNSTVMTDKDSQEVINEEINEQTKNSIMLINLDINSPTNTSNGINRTEYLEGEYEIPKIITAEYSNDTVISEIQGNEAVPNLDFVETPDSGNIIPDQTYSDTIENQWNKSNGNLSNSSKQNENVPSSNIKDKVNDTSLDITGKLYFKYGSEYVPASFVQQPDGHVNVALEILLLCKSNKKDQSKLIQAICNCIDL